MTPELFLKIGLAFASMSPLWIPTILWIEYHQKTRRNRS
jgi:hypothetical protein